jgi:hypothetical protein
VILGHFTAMEHLELLLGSGVLLVTESNIGAPDTPEMKAMGVSPRGEDIGPKVVWLTDLDDPRLAGITGLTGTKGSVLLTVDVPESEVHWWPEWSRRHGIDERWYAALAHRADPDRFWVIERNIPWNEWTEISAGPVRRRRRTRCICGSGRRFKDCHRGRRLRVWQPADGITVRYTIEEIRARGQSIVSGPDGSPMVRDAAGNLWPLDP